MGTTLKNNYFIKEQLENIKKENLKGVSPNCLQDIFKLRNLELKTKIDNTFKIDFVYLWVDGNNTKWKSKKDCELSKLGKHKENAVCDGRFRDNNELLYSLRSVEKFAPWVNNIFIVTDKQIPKWLNLNNPKISIIDHSQIIPKKFLPTFNSINIELYLEKIPGLSEYFVFFNDDVFLGNYVSPSYFFDNNLNPKYVLKKSKLPLEYNRFSELFYDFFKSPDITKYKLIHTPTPYRKSYIADSKFILGKRVKEMSFYKFRPVEYMAHRFHFVLFDILLNRATFRIQSRHPVNNSVIIRYYLKRLYSLETYREYKENVNLIKNIDKYKPYTFCLNDNEIITEEEIDLYSNFLKKYFPNKSEFEV